MIVVSYRKSACQTKMRSGNPELENRIKKRVTNYDVIKPS